MRPMAITYYRSSLRWSQTAINRRLVAAEFRKS